MTKMKELISLQISMQVFVFLISLDINNFILLLFRK